MLPTGEDAETGECLTFLSQPPSDEAPGPLGARIKAQTWLECNLKEDRIDERIDASLRRVKRDIPQ